jgi:hypothetical protein
MLAFRSEGHLVRWLQQTDRERGATLTIAQTYGLATAFYATKRDAAWRRRTSEESQLLFTRLGLTGPFWRIAISS